MLRATATVETPTPERYAKQLVSHLGRKVPAVELPDGSHQLRLSAGVAIVRVDADALVMEATGVDDLSLAAVQDVLARHLVRFGSRQELEVVWGAAAPDDGG